MSAQPNNSILIGFRVLQEVIGIGRPVGSREISRRLSIEHSKANRTLGTLVSTGLLQKRSDRKYLPGPAVHVLSALSLRASGLIPAALPILGPLQAEGVTVALGARWGDTVVYLLHASPDQPLAASAGAHALFPANQSILGQVLPEHPDSANQSTLSLLPATSYSYCDRTSYHSWAARIPGVNYVGVAAVVSDGHEWSVATNETRQRLFCIAEEIGSAFR